MLFICSDKLAVIAKSYDARITQDRYNRESRHVIVLGILRLVLCAKDN